MRTAIEVASCTDFLALRRRKRIGRALLCAGLAVGALADSSRAGAGPLMWQFEGPAASRTPASALPPAAQAPSVPGRPLVWTLDSSAEPSPVATTGSPSVQPAAPAAPPAQAKPAGQDLQPNGYPRYGVPADAAFAPAYIGGAMPSAYIAGWGSYYFGLSGGTPGKLRDGAVDASFNAGFGIGDFFNTVALQVDWGVGSIKNIGANGGLSFSLGRLIVDQPRFQMAAAGGVFSAYTYGTEGNPEPASGYGVLTLATPLRPQQWDFQQVLQLSLGYGGWQFAYLDPITFEGNTEGFFTALGVQVTKNTGLSASWSARGTNLNFSYSPFREIPLYFNLLGADLFDVSPWGPRAVFTITWGDDFRTALF